MEQNLVTMAELPQREYLNRTYNLVVLPEGTVADGLIEVPEGMNFAWEDDDSIWFTQSVMGYRDAKIIWQREQPLLGEAPAMMHNTSDPVELTLADRQSQYGSFENVATTTQNLYDLTSRGDMTNVQREALHMICSKLARIANGDPNHVDSWHDIAGYATLVVKDLEK